MPDRPARMATLQGNCQRRSVAELQLEALVRRVEPEPAVETVRLDPLLVARQLHERASAPPRLADGPRDQLAADPAPAQVVAHAHGLDLRARPAPPGDAGDERQLH